MRNPAIGPARGEIKIVGKSGQTALGKRYAGKALRLEGRRDNSVLLTPIAIVPEKQLWTLQEPHRSKIQRGLAWAQRTAPRETNIDTLMKEQPRRGGRSNV